MGKIPEINRNAPKSICGFGSKLSLRVLEEICMHIDLLMQMSALYSESTIAHISHCFHLQIVTVHMDFIGTLWKQAL